MKNTANYNGIDFEIDFRGLSGKTTKYYTVRNFGKVIGAMKCYHGDGMKQNPYVTRREGSTEEIPFVSQADAVDYLLAGAR